MIRHCFATALCLLLVSPLVTHAADWKSPMTIWLTPLDGPRFELGQIELKPAENGYEYSLHFDHSKFGDYFLSMREFKCFEHPKQMLCHVVYPYDKPRTISENHLTNLEYDLIFIHRKSTDYGINLWNGVYYKLEAHGDKLIGALHEMDLNVLASPPEAGVVYPITDNDLYPGAPENHAYPSLTIE